MGGTSQMITTDVDASKSIASELEALPECTNFPPELSELCSQVLSTVASPDFPGALIPEALSNGVLQIIATATPNDWRRLRPVLQAFAGPTLTSFNGLPIVPNADSAVAQFLEKVGVRVASTILLPMDPQIRSGALRALIRVHETLARAPRHARTTPEPTSWLLARFQDHLNLGRRDAAASILNRLRDELRLDALNLKWLQVQLHATFDDWVGVTGISGFSNLVVARKPPAVTAILLEALYKVHLAPHFERDHLTVQELYVQKVRPLALPMLTLPYPSSLTEGGWRLFGLEAITSPGQKELELGLTARTAALGWLAERIVLKEQSSSPTIEGSGPAPRFATKDEYFESLDSVAAAGVALARLSEKQRLELAKTEIFTSTLQALRSEELETSAVTSWVEWFSRVGDPNFTRALEVARIGAEQWSITDQIGDPTDVQILVDAMGAAQANDLAAQRTSLALPYLVASVRRDPNFPSMALAPVYGNLMTLLALSASRGGAVYDSSQILIEALLVVGLNLRDYRALMADVEELAGEGFGVDMVFWALDVIEALMRNATPDPVSRENLVNLVLSRTAAIKARLSRLQLEAVRRLAVEFGWKIDDLDLSVPQTNQDNFARRMAGKKVAIYSLSEGASRQAKVAIEAAAPDVEVECNADLVGSARLRALARNSDIFIVAWSAAKHSATEFIREHRRDRTLLYAKGKGFTSLLRAVEDHLRLSQGPL
jgi:hypothetical protein